ncbi:hypothetical protein HMN09_00994700 [Mycena chlorophos]|uniref:Uncharacterized protein n=1 Tax=Mycena chlorophos TaxID=658473 RepID=A0A8H6SL75_MYCCL|nr:hypothetical protein HMN09_00994700 [Mycena chlorophos]
MQSPSASAPIPSEKFYDKLGSLVMLSNDDPPVEFRLKKDKISAPLVLSFVSYLQVVGGDGGGASAPTELEDDERTAPEYSRQTNFSANVLEWVCRFIQSDSRVEDETWPRTLADIDLQTAIEVVRWCTEAHFHRPGDHFGRLIRIDPSNQVPDIAPRLATSELIELGKHGMRIRDMRLLHHLTPRLFEVDDDEQWLVAGDSKMVAAWVS